MTWDAILKAGAEGGARLEALRQFLLKGGTALVTPLPAGTAGTGRKPDWLAIAPGSLQGSSNGLALTVLDKAGAIFDDVRDARGEVALRNVKVFRYLPLRVESQAAPLLGLEDGAITLAAQKVGQGGITSLVAGDPPAGLPAGSEALVVQSLGGSPLDWKGPAGQFTTFPRVGVYALRLGKETRWVAVRSSEKEGRRKFIAGDTLAALGNLAYSVEGMSGSESARAEFRREERSLDLSLPLLLLAFVCLAMEGWLANPAPLKPRPAAIR